MQNFDPRTPPNKPPPQGVERYLGADVRKAGAEKGRKVFEHAVDQGYMPLLVGALTISILTTLVMIMGEDRSKHARKQDMPHIGHLAEMDDPIARCHLSDDYTVRNGKAVLRLNRRTQREDECQAMAPKGSKVVPAVADCPFLMSVYTGEDVVSTSIRVSGQWEPRESTLIADLPEDSVFLDIGANIGWHSLIALSLGHTVYAFEPLSENVDMLKHTMCLNPGLDSRLQLYTTAVSDSVTSSSGCSISSPPDNQGNGQLRCGAKKQGGGGSEGEGRAVMLQTLDTSVPKGTSIDLVKIDVEGHELPVARGGSDLFSGRQGHVAPRYVVAEFCPSMMRQQGFSPRDFLIFFMDRGYTIHFCSDIKTLPNGRLPDAERLEAEASEAKKHGGSHQAAGSKKADVRLARGGVDDFVRDLGEGATTVEMSKKA